MQSLTLNRQELRYYFSKVHNTRFHAEHRGSSWLAVLEHPEQGILQGATDADGEDGSYVHQIPRTFSASLWLSRAHIVLARNSIECREKQLAQSLININPASFVAASCLRGGHASGSW